MLKQSSARKTRAGKTASPSKGRTKRNLPAGERRRVLLDAAVQLFSEKGMSITLQDVADRASVTQPLIHRYFPTRADLITAICDRIQNAHWDPEWRVVLTDRTRPIEERIQGFYSLYLPHIYRDSWYRGFWYAALTDPSFADSYLGHVGHELLVTIIGEIRDHYGYPTVDDVPNFEREFELVWGMHSTMVFVGIRRYVYHSPVSDDIGTTVRDQMHAYLLVAPQVLEDLMPGQGPARPRTAKPRPAKPPAAAKKPSAQRRRPAKA
jgi:AcrR family transcriptional regulator